jgi:hypothetical protein
VAAGYTALDKPDTWRTIVESYVDAGATWWMERFHGDRGSLDHTRERLRAGPPRV